MFDDEDFKQNKKPDYKPGKFKRWLDLYASSSNGRFNTNDVLILLISSSVWIFMITMSICLVERLYFKN